LGNQKLGHCCWDFLKTWKVRLMTFISRTILRHSGAAQRAEPGIHNHGCL